MPVESLWSCLRRKELGSRNLVPFRAERFNVMDGHSAAAGVSIECPPLSVFEGYQAVQAWKEAAGNTMQDVRHEIEQETNYG